MYGTQNTELLTGHLLLVTCIIRTCIISISGCRVLLDFCAVYYNPFQSPSLAPISYLQQLYESYSTAALVL